ncbi:MAG: hypothetical protein CMJ58_12515 [Planctomycetaceae bacterium]|nr:hypothetical protein [Planctomycetaceae bacterium]
MDKETYVKLLERVEEYGDMSPAKLARTWCKRLSPDSNPVLIRKGFPRGYLMMQLLQQEFGRPAEDGAPRLDDTHCIAVTREKSQT